MSNNDFSSINDPYEQFVNQAKYQNNLIEMDKSSKFHKKVKKLQQVMKQAKTNMLNGFMMGFMVGGLFGLVIGLYSAYQSKRLIAIPMSVIVSGGSFGFIMGCGSIIRNDTIQNIKQNKSEQQYLSQNEWINVYKFNLLNKNKFQSFA